MPSLWSCSGSGIVPFFLLLHNSNYFKDVPLPRARKMPACLQPLLWRSKRPCLPGNRQTIFVLPTSTLPGWLHSGGLLRLDVVRQAAEIYRRGGNAPVPRHHQFLPRRPHACLCRHSNGFSQCCQQRAWKRWAFPRYIHGSTGGSSRWSGRASEM